MNTPAAALTVAEFESLEFFRGIEWESLAGYLEAARIGHYPPGALLLGPPMKERELYIILEGSLEVRLDSIDGVVAASLTMGECVGEMSVFDNHDPSAWVVCRESCRLLCLKRETAFAMLQASHELAMNLLQILSRRVRYSNHSLSEGQRQVRNAEQKATVDNLTGLHNRHWMSEMFAREIIRCNAGDSDLCLIMADLDFFKRVNDAHGHLVGDRVLAHTARNISRTLRPTDMVTRFGGEEFCVLLPGTAVDIAELIAERLRKQVEKSPIVLDDGTPLLVTISLGISQRRQGDTLEMLLGRADQALYGAKQAGRNRVLSLAP